MNHSSPHTAHHGAQHTHGHEHGHGHGHDAGGQAEILDLDAEVLAEHIASITAWLPVRTAPRHVVDLGSGTGAGTLALLRRFPEAEVTAVDVSAEHLDRLREKAAAAGAADRVRTVRADLDAAAWPALGAPELVWASASLHHMADPAHALRRVRDTLAPGGLLAVVELGGFPRFLPPDAPAQAPGLEERCHAALDRHHAEHVPHRGADWGAALTAAGLTVEAERTLAVAVGPPPTDAVRRYALSGLRRIRDGAADALAPGDLAVLDQLLDTEGPYSLLRRDDLGVRTERTVWAARRA
ncbi:class I SAM-dependent methyltransferase [Streptomyces avicenniae]|uniref:class I SAM-dependent methyltransferase n=1 Tax=Streptomyces avicenniae TaxID=500153 RepID=UPI00069AD0B2|nr:class I SAM-dependent methyltransferase [Streptomyces avicenniae]